MSWGRPFKPTHGLARKPEYGIWTNMIRRCHDEDDASYGRYGARGITVCARWRESVTNFYKDVGPRPTPKHSLDRYPNNDGNYEPGNVRWATQKQQTRNTRANRIIRFQGRDWVLAELCEHVGLSYPLAHVRLRKGWSVERTFTTPSRGRQPNGAGCVRDAARAAQRTKFRATLCASDAVEIRSGLKRGESCAALARFYGVSTTAVSHIKHGKTWRSA